MFGMLVENVHCPQRSCRRISCIMPVTFVGSCPYVLDMCKQTYAPDMTPAYVAEMEMGVERGMRVG